MIFRLKKQSNLIKKVCSCRLLSLINKQWVLQKNINRNVRRLPRFMRRLYNHGLTTTSGGNISLRISDDLIAITPSATDKGSMKWKEVGLMTLKGENLTPDLKPSIESEMHLSIYKKKDVKAIVHAHPVFATAFTAMKSKINTSLTAEACAILGEPVFVPYALMGTKELAQIVADKILQNQIFFFSKIMEFLQWDQIFFRHSIRLRFWKMLQR